MVDFYRWSADLVHSERWSNEHLAGRQFLIRVRNRIQFSAYAAYKQEHKVNMGCVERDREMKRRRKRHEKLVKLRKLYKDTSNEGEKAELLAKARKISPLFSFEKAD